MLHGFWSRIFISCQSKVMCLKLRTFKVAFSPSKKIHNKAADLHVPERARSKRRLPWMDEDICKKRKALYNAFEMKNINHNAENMMRVEDAKAELGKAYYMEQKKYVEGKISIIKTSHVNRQARLVWAMVNEVTD